MRYIEIDVPIYDWSLCVVTLYDEGDKEEYVELCKKHNIEEEQSSEDIEKITNGIRDFAVCYTTKETHDTLICVGPWTYSYMMHGNLAHKIRHFVDDIQNQLVLETGECTAYLTGFITVEIYKRIDELT